MSAENSNRARGRRRTSRTPRLERLEPREMPTFVMIHHPGTPSTAQVHSAAPVAPPGASAGGEQLGTPTPHEIQRQLYVGRFKGSYTVGPGRYTSEAAALSSLGYGGANQS